MTEHAFSLATATIAELRDALESGRTTSVELVAASLDRIAAYDRHGLHLNAVPILNPDLFAEARASDARRRAGATLGPLDGIPYTAKDSYAIRGLTVASGSPAFENLVAGDDAFTIARLRAGGAVLIGKTTMPPMANGGMQRGVYGRAESPYNADFLTAAFASGSSNGSGTGTAAGFGTFGLGEETWSSGRAPASNNGLVAYTPSRGVISVRGNWPLVPTMDVVVPHTRTVADMLEVLDVIVADDSDTRGDFWRVQPWVEIPAASAVRPHSYRALAAGASVAGKRFGIPRLYVNAEPDAANPIDTRPSVIALWEAARRDLEALGAEVVEVDFPVVTNYEGDATMDARGFVPAEYAEREIWDLSIWSWNDFLDANGDPALHALADVEADKIFPQPTGALPDQYGEADFDIREYVWRAREGITPLEQIPTIEDGLRGLERTRAVDLEQWMDELGLDAVLFPASADVGPADADTNPESAALAWRNGTWVANGNTVIRHLGIPTVTVPMGVMADIGMPVGLTIAGRAYDDTALLRYAAAFEASGERRIAPPRTPPLPGELLRDEPVAASAGAGLVIDDLVVTATPDAASDAVVIVVEGRVSATSAEEASVEVHVDGEPIPVALHDGRLRAEVSVPASRYAYVHSEWREPYGSIVLVLARAGGDAVADYRVVNGQA